MSGAVSEPAPEQGSPSRPVFAAFGEHHLVAGAIVGVVALQVFMIFTQSMNWDEFFHYSQVYELQRGELTRDYQVLHARVFAWVPLLGGDIITQLQVARLGMLGFELVAFLAVVGLARQVADRTAAWLAGLAWLAGGYVFLHGFSFRGDPMATAGLMTALYIVSRRKLTWPMILLASAAVAFAFMTTLKSVFYAPCFAGLAWLRFTQSADRWGLVRRYAAVATLAPLFFAAMYFLHRSGLPTVEVTAPRLPSNGTRFFAEGLFPRGRYAVTQLTMAPVLPLAVGIAAWLAWCARQHAKLIALAGLVVPALAVILYRNSFPYYFVFALAPFVVAAAAGLASLKGRFGTVLLVVALLTSPIVLTLKEPKNILPRQRAVITEVNRLFPRDTLHLSYTGMPADYPRVLNHLVSGIGIEGYYGAGRPKIAEAITAGKLAFVIADNPVVTAALAGKPMPRTLLPADVAGLQRNYVNYWGPIWLPGKHVDRAGALEIDIAGPYTLAGAPVMLNGGRLSPGATVTLSRGKHRVAPAADGKSTFWLGNRAPVSPTQPLTGPYYYGF